MNTERAFYRKSTRTPKSKANVLVIVVQDYLTARVPAKCFFATNFCLKDQVQVSLSYDLMRHALISQNITRYKVGCSQMDVNRQNSARNFLKQKDPSLKYNLFRTYLTNSSHNIGYEKLNLDSYPNDLAKKILSKFKICSINKHHSHFKSKSVSNEFEFKKFLHFKKPLSSQELNRLDLDSNLVLGGRFIAPLCLQELFYNIGKKEEYEKLTKINQTNKIIKYSYSLIKRYLDYSLTKHEIIKKYIDTKLNQMTIILVPFLKREENLIDLLANLHSFLQRQFLNYKIVIAEQLNTNDGFNKGRIYNTAIDYIIKKWGSEVGCLILHDVDLIPESDHNIYECNNNFYNYLYTNSLDTWTYSPRHLSYSIRHDLNVDQISLQSYSRNPYELLVGGVLCISPKVYQYVNGFSNEYWNWGAEDDGKN
ncbi:beta-1-4-galactosyltransferase 3 [Brachionus plicatilis]|uniref:Beta-1,4-galactosyltransferase n=1 Tax=Brachionus plicatilis TaxID=10195 RepID=A0A3M7Q4X4_BRAPC|nr:beta-1-4-galactosyltransferase 3 [Brachionus plicatilis]